MDKRHISKTQSGVVLIVALVMLLLLTVIGVAGSNVTGLEEKMAGNMRDRNLAFQAAESALNAGESWLASNTFTCTPTSGRFNPRDKDCNSGTAETSEVWDSITWASTDSVAYTGVLSNLSANPRYIIEDLGCLPAPAACPGVHNYRVTARAIGGSAETIVMLQSIYQI
ncbi:pilus assembly PilX family protein [Methylomonas sp. 2BW1-5-20]|uniref:pilus assembly PilX family protein n=1 Tax=Methylomonas sp. 2BW1-5-20 TaxID=3376686 RepID=UPI00404DC1BA